MNRERQGIYTSQISFINGVRSYLDGVFCPKSKLFILRTTSSVWLHLLLYVDDVKLLKMNEDKIQKLPLGLIPIHNTSAILSQTTNSLSWSNKNILKKSDFVKYSKVFVKTYYILDNFTVN